MPIPKLSRISLDGTPWKNNPDFVEELSAGTFISFRSHLMHCSDEKNEFREMTVYDYQCVIVMLSYWENHRPLLARLMDEYIPVVEIRKAPLTTTVESTSVDINSGEATPDPLQLTYFSSSKNTAELLRKVTPDQFIDLIWHFVDSVSKDWIEKTFSIIFKAFDPITPDVEIALKNE